MSLMSSITDYIEADEDWDELMADRLHPVQAPQDEVAPWVVYRMDKEPRDYSIDGPTELRMADLEFKIQSAEYDQCHEIREMLIRILDGFRGVMGDVVITHILFMDSRDGETKDEVLDLFSVFCDISVWYKLA